MTTTDEGMSAQTTPFESSSDTLFAEAQSCSLRQEVERALKNYFEQLDAESVTGLYELVLAEVEAPLLEAVLRHTGSNQSKASIMLGLNRGTLRKKLKQYGLL